MIAKVSTRLCQRAKPKKVCICWASQRFFKRVLTSVTCVELRSSAEWSESATVGHAWWDETFEVQLDDESAVISFILWENIGKSYRYFPLKTASISLAFSLNAIANGTWHCMQEYWYSCRASWNSSPWTQHQAAALAKEVQNFLPRGQNHDRKMSGSQRVCSGIVIW